MCKRICVGLMVFAVLVIALSGCGNKLLQAQGQNEVVAKNPHNPQLADLNAKLGAIVDEKTALEAVDTFSGYVISHLDKEIPGNAEVKISAIPVSLRENFAKVESAARLKLAGASSSGAAEEDLVSLEKLQDVLEEVQPESRRIEIDKTQIASTQKVLREAIPNLTSTDSEQMTPLEASIITYHMLTGDDGSGAAGIYPLEATPEKLNEFAGKLTQGEEVQP